MNATSCVMIGSQKWGERNELPKLKSLNTCKEGGQIREWQWKGQDPTETWWHCKMKTAECEESVKRREPD